MEIKEYHVPEKSAGVRLDAYCAEQEPDFSRGYIKNLLAEGAVKVDGSQKKASYKLKGKEIITMEVPEPVESAIEPENIPLEIIYEDDDVIVVNKPKGMVVHPAPGSPSGTLVNALMYHTGALSNINGVFRPGIIHRIDKDTSGLLMVAKNNAAHQNLTEQLKAHAITRQYKALVKGIMENNRGTIDMPRPSRAPPTSGAAWPCATCRAPGRPSRPSACSSASRRVPKTTGSASSSASSSPGALIRFACICRPLAIPLPVIPCIKVIKKIPSKQRGSAFMPSC